jgi:hypothetical protein
MAFVTLLTFKDGLANPARRDGTPRLMHSVYLDKNSQLRIRLNFLSINCSLNAQGVMTTWGIAMVRPNWKSKEIPVNGFCAVCGYKMNWKLILGNMVQTGEKSDWPHEKKAAEPLTPRRVSPES